MAIIGYVFVIIVLIIMFVVMFSKFINDICDMKSDADALNDSMTSAIQGLNMVVIDFFKMLKSAENNSDRIIYGSPIFYDYVSKNNSLINCPLICWTKEILEKSLERNIENAPQDYNIDINIENLKTNKDGLIVSEQLIPDDWKIFIKDSIDKFIKEIL